MKYLFDLDTLTYLSDPDSAFFKTTSKKAAQLTNEDSPCISILTLYELQYSLANTSNSDIKTKIKTLINWLAEDFEILPLSARGGVLRTIKTRFETKNRHQQKSTKEAQY